MKSSHAVLRIWLPLLGSLIFLPSVAWADEPITSIDAVVGIPVPVHPEAADDRIYFQDGQRLEGFQLSENGPVCRFHLKKVPRKDWIMDAKDELQVGKQYISGYGEYHFDVQSRLFDTLVCFIHSPADDRGPITMPEVIHALRGQLAVQTDPTRVLTRVLASVEHVNRSPSDGYPCVSDRQSSGRDEESKAELRAKAETRHAGCGE